MTFLLLSLPEKYWDLHPKYPENLREKHMFTGLQLSQLDRQSRHA